MRDSLVLCLVLFSLFCLVQCMRIERNIARVLDDYGERIGWLETHRDVVNRDLLKLEKEIERWENMK